MFNRINEVNYAGMFPGNINIVPPERVLEAWKNDYEEMKVHMINETVEISWDDILTAAHEITEKIHSMSLSEGDFLNKTKLEYLTALYSDLIGKVKNRNFKDVAMLLNGRELTQVERQCIKEILIDKANRRNFEIATKTTLE